MVLLLKCEKETHSFNSKGHESIWLVFPNKSSISSRTYVWDNYSCVNTNNRRDKSSAPPMSPPISSHVTCPTCP
ncbi:hypothetical protein OSTOST_03420 [Ostertagia ostertagi]